MGFNSAFKGLKLLKKPGNGRLNNVNDPNRPQCVKMTLEIEACREERSVSNMNTA